MKTLFLRLDRATGFLSCILNPKYADIIGSLFTHYAQKVSFFACLIYGAVLFLGIGINVVTWPILLNYVVLTIIVTEVVFIVTMKTFGRGTLSGELAKSMTIPSAFAHVLIPLCLAAIGLFAHHYFFIGAVSGNTLSIFVEVILMAMISGTLYPLCLANIQLGIIRLCLIDKSE